MLDWSLEVGAECMGLWRREGLMDGILIGSCVTEQERIECALETDTGDIGGMGKSLQELGGLLLISDAGGFWGTEWDDQRSGRRISASGRKKKRNLGRKRRKQERNIRRQRRKKAESGRKGRENQKDGTLPEVQEYQKKSDRIMTVEEVQEEVLKASETGNSYQAPGPHPPESPRPEPSRPLPGIPCDDPFNDGYFTDCRKIRPSDCSALCRQNGCFCSNRFVMYGYQNFGHLLLCRNHRGQYILGVPGGYSQQERFMANMFGFPYFKECPDIHIPGGKGGYWYCFINI